MKSESVGLGVPNNGEPLAVMVNERKSHFESKDASTPYHSKCQIDTTGLSESESGPGRILTRSRLQPHGAVFTILIPEDTPYGRLSSRCWRDSSEVSFGLLGPHDVAIPVEMVRGSEIFVSRNLNLTSATAKPPPRPSKPLVFRSIQSSFSPPWQSGLSPVRWSSPPTRHHISSPYDLTAI